MLSQNEPYHLMSRRPSKYFNPGFTFPFVDSRLLSRHWETVDDTAPRHTRHWQGFSTVLFHVERAITRCMSRGLTCHVVTRPTNQRRRAPARGLGGTVKNVRLVILDNCNGDPSANPLFLILMI